MVDPGLCKKGCILFVKVLSSQPLNMFELKRVMMYLYRSEKDNRRGLPCAFSLSLSLCLCSRPLPPLQLTPEFTDLLAFCSCPLCLGSEEHSTHRLLLSWVEHPQINLDKIQQKIHEKLSSPLSLLLQAISHLTHYVLLQHMQGAMQKSGRNLVSHFCQHCYFILEFTMTFFNGFSHLERQEVLEEPRLFSHIVCIVLKST